MEDITPLDIQIFIKWLNDSGRSEAAISHAVKAVKKVYNWAIEEAEILDI